MKWKKHGRNSRRANYYEFWDYLDSDGNLLAFVRLDKRKDEYRVFANNFEDRELEPNYHGPFKTMADAKGHIVAYFVNKRLEESNG